MRRLRLAILAALILAFAASPAAAFKLKTPVTDAINIYENLKVVRDITTDDEDQHFWAFINRFNLQVKKSMLLVGVRWDFESFLVDQDDTFQARYTFRKFFIDVNQRPVHFRIGDTFLQEGQGLVFSLKKVDEFGEDTTLQGALMEINNDYFEYGSFAGSINPLDEDEVKPAWEYSSPDDPPKLLDMEEAPPKWPDRDLAWGGHLAGIWPGWFSAGMHYSSVYKRIDPVFDPPDFEADDLWDTFSLSFGMPNIKYYGSFYAEYAWAERRDKKRNGPDVLSEGRGAYASAIGYVGPVTLSLEYLDYFNFTHPYSEPPNLENPKVAFNETPHFDDEIGGKLGVQVLIPVVDVSGSVYYFHLLTHKDQIENTGARFDVNDLQAHYDLSERVLEHETMHVYGGFDKTFANAAFVFAHGGYREKPDGRWVHTELDGGSPIYGPHSLSAGIHWKNFYGFPVFGTDDDIAYESQLYQLTYAWSPYFSLTGNYEKSNEPAAESGQGGAVPVGDEDADENFWGVEALIQPVSQASLRMFYGRQKGGITCAAGLCREVPSFEGFKAELALRF